MYGCECEDICEHVCMCICLCVYVCLYVCLSVSAPMGTLIRKMVQIESLGSLLLNLGFKLRFCTGSTILSW